MGFQICAENTAGNTGIFLLLLSSTNKGSRPFWSLIPGKEQETQVETSKVMEREVSYI